MKNLLTFAGVVVFSASFAAPALAQNIGVSATVSASTSVGNTSVSTQVSGKAQKIIDRSNSEIDARITALNNLSARINGLKNVSAGEKASIAAAVQNNISGLNSLHATIDADSDATTLQTQEKTIFTSYRIYALVVPQGYLLAASDRVHTMAGLFATLSVKLQSRIAAMQAAGKDVTTLQADLSDMNAKVADAQTHASAATTGVVNLMPDQGNATIAANNKTALVASRGDIKIATSDIEAARRDAAAILSGTKGYGSVSASATTTVQ